MNPLWWPFDTTGFVPRWRCGHWYAELGWLHITSDILIWLAYLAIPAVLLYFLRRRRDIPFPKILWLFGLFIVACGTTHLIEAIIFWEPVYRLAGLVKLLTAVVSWATVIALAPIIPQVLAMRTLTELEHEVSARTAELRETNEVLEREVQERRRVERQILEQQEWLQVILASIGEGIIATDVRGNVIFLNPAAEALTGFRQDDAVGKSLDMVFRTDDEGEGSASGPGSSRPFELSTNQSPHHHILIHRDGTRRLVEKSISPIRLDSSIFAGVVLMFTDITDRTRLEEQLRQSQKMESVGRLAGGVAHDFNNMLTIINGCSELVLGSLAENDPSTPLLKEVTTAGERAAALTRQLLAFSRQQLVAPQVININQVVSDTEKMLRRLLGEDVQMRIELEPIPWLVRADRGQLEQVLMNLAVNARDAMPQGGRLTISTRNHYFDKDEVRGSFEMPIGPHVILEIGDTGSGLTEADKARMFEPFFTTKAKGSGTGLGLAVVHGIVTQAGGRIVVQSEPGEGTIFRIYLPRTMEAETAPTNADADCGDLPRGKETILVAEDESGVRSLVRDVLTRCGYKVIDAADGPRAIQLAAAHPSTIHLLVTDVVMPGMRGSELADRIRKVHAESKVLFMSGYTDDAVLRNGVMSEEVDFLHKPFTPGAIARKVREILDTPTTRVGGSVHMTQLVEQG